MYTRFEYLKLLQNKYNPTVICLQETNLKSNQTPKLKGYNCYQTNRSNFVHASGGVAILIKNNFHAQTITLQSNYKVIAIKTNLPYNINICNIYLPNSHLIIQEDVENLIKQLPKPFILVGDFNSHNNLWGSNHTDKRGKIIDQILEDTEMMLLNDGTPTYFSARSGLQSAIDLSICSTSLVCNIQWCSIDCLYDSDHYPIIMTLVTNNCPTTHEKFYQPIKWRLNITDWLLYTNHISQQIKNLEPISTNTQLSIDQILQAFTNIICQAADTNLPRVKFQSNSMKKTVPWWNKNCERTIKEKKEAFNKYKKHRTEENRIFFIKHGRKPGKP